jgi:hypothetical protein
LRAESGVGGQGDFVPSCLVAKLLRKMIEILITTDASILSFALPSDVDQVLVAKIP